MTFSIVAFDPKTKDLGVAVESKFPAVGNAVPFAQAGVGAIATQSSSCATRPAGRCAPPICLALCSAAISRT